MSDARQRDLELERIRATYAAYDGAERTRLWDPANPGFARLARERDAATAELLRRSLPPDGGRLIDLGCGDGGMALVTRAHGIDVPVVGVDLLPDRLAKARQRAPWASFVEASVDALPLPNDSFEVATALTLFSSLPSPAMEEAAAREIGRVLRPGGWLIWYDLRVSNPSNRAVHGLSRERIGALFPGWTQELRSMTLAPPLARRLGHATPIAYPLLAAIPWLRTHLVGRLRCPT